MSGIRENDKIMPVITVVLYWGDKKIDFDFNSVDKPVMLNDKSLSDIEEGNMEYKILLLYKCTPL